MDSKIYMDLSISRNGQLGCPFHEMDNLLVHFAKWTISHLGHNIYKIKNRQERSLPAKLRFGTLPLQVEIGRWQNIKFEDRVCQICHTGVEDENHLVFYCSGYNEERHNFENNMCSIQKNWRTLSCSEKFVILMQKENILIFTNFLSNILAKRKSYFSH